MKNLGTSLLSREPFSEIMMGNYALVRAMIEAGTEVVSSYPGSPTPEIGEAIVAIPEKRRPFYFEFSVNEKVATELAFGAAINGRLSTVFFKSVGLNVAADSLVQLPLMELIGGMVVVIGDDPGANSSQNEQDNRHFARMAYMPVFEPGDPQEVYEMYLEAARISKERRMPVLLRLSTHICHAKRRLSFGSYEESPGSPSEKPAQFDSAKGPYIPLTSRAIDLKRRAMEKLRAMEEYSEACPHNRLVDHDNRRIGVVTSGLPFYSLMDILEGTPPRRQRAERPEAEHSGAGRPDILKLALSYPIPKKLLADFCKNHDEILVLEELDPILEQEIKALAFDEELSVKIYGKEEAEDLIGEYRPEKVRRILARYLPEYALAREPEENEAPQGSDRPAQMCPGCGHRSAFHAIKKVIEKDTITVADIGCHTLGALPPYYMGEVLLSMGHSNGTGAGLSLFNKERKVITFLGDSTFFHAGLPGVVNAVYHRYNITLVVMLNDTTAMTGHQDHAGTGKTAVGTGARVSVRRALEGLGVQHIAEADTYNQKKLGELVGEALEYEGFSVVIARHPCMLKFSRERRRAGKSVAAQARVDQETCRRIHHCVELFACPSFVRGEKGEVRVNPDLCIGDGSCIQTCPVEAIELEEEN